MNDASVGRVAEVGKRRYDATTRKQQARQTRERILQAAGDLFAEQGYPATTMAQIARRAEVSLDTVYAAVGAKPALFRELVEAAISGTAQAVPAEQREYVRAIRMEPDPEAKLRIYAAALRQIHARLAPLLSVVQAAASQSPEIADLWHSIAERRSANMRLFAADLAATGRLRPDVDVDSAADVIWATNSAEFYLLLVHDRGWSPQRFESWLADSWSRLLLTEPEP